MALNWASESTKLYMAALGSLQTSNNDFVSVRELNYSLTRTIMSPRSLSVSLSVLGSTVLKFSQQVCIASSQGLSDFLQDDRIPFSPLNFLLSSFETESFFHPLGYSSLLYQRAHLDTASFSIALLETEIYHTTYCEQARRLNEG